MTNLTVSPATQPAEAKAPHAPRAYKYYDLLMVAFVTVLICSNFIAAGKVARIGSFEFGAGVVFFPLSATCLATSSPRSTATPDRGR